MSWSDLQPGVRLAIMAVGFLVVALLLWTLVVSPIRSREANVSTRITDAESQLDQVERQIEAVPPATDAERRAWQSSSDALLGQLGPESELPLFLESLVRLAEAQGVEAYVSAAQGADGNRQPSQSDQVLASIPGVRRVPLEVRAYSDYDKLGQFVAQVGRLGWVTEIGGVEMVRQFPEVASVVQLTVYFRADSARAGESMPPATPQGGQPMGAQGRG